MEQLDIIEFTPYKGVVVFGSPDRTKNYVQVHNIGKKGWEEGKPFNREDLAHLALAIKTEQVSSLKLGGFIPDNLLYFQPGVAGSQFIWYSLPDQKHINFTAEVKIPSRTYKVPGLIMAVSGKKMYVFAFKGNKKPNAKTELYHAPFFNIYSDGSVCMGTVSEARAKALLHEETDRWERRFFGGNFTSAHGESDRLAKGFNFKKVYQLAKTRFPEKALAKAKHKDLQAFLNKLMTERRGLDE